MSNQRVKIGRIVHSHGSAANLARLNPTPLRGELLIEYDTGKMKLGDGTTKWNALPYFTGPPGPRGPKGQKGDTGPAEIGDVKGSIGNPYTLPANANYDEIVEPGSYRPTGSTETKNYENAPLVGGQRLFVIPPYDSTLNAMQLVLGYYRLHSRSKTSKGSWTSWATYLADLDVVDNLESEEAKLPLSARQRQRLYELIPKSINDLSHYVLDKNFISSNSNLDDVDEPGLYAMVDYDISKTLENCPTRSGFVMEVGIMHGGIGSQRRIQKIIDVENNIFTRQRNAHGVWNDWLTLAFLDNIPTSLMDLADSLYNAKIIEKNDDLNDIVEEGYYRCRDNTVPNTVSNAPVAHGFRLIVFNQYGSSTDNKIHLIISTEGVYHRRKFNGVWGSWKGFLSNHDIATDLTTGGADKVASAETVKQLNQKIKALEARIAALEA